MKSKDDFMNGMDSPDVGNVYLTGLSGVGKSTVGPLLAERLGWTFIDTDKLIEEATGMAVTDIFSTLGEETFRERETQMIDHLSSILRELVVSLGGGAILREGNRTLMRESGVVIYLKASPSLLAERLYGASEERPLLKADSNAQLLHNLENLLEERAALYEQADITVETDGATVEDIVSRIQEALDSGDEPAEL